jgi:NDP-sugar pyrophosphorylase family protein
MKKALIFSAGLGTRLYPHTNDTPKALVKIHDKTLLEIVILKFIALGVSDIIVNVHHFPDQVISFLKAHQNFGIHIAVSDERNQLLDTGGGIKKQHGFLMRVNRSLFTMWMCLPILI